jgi:hypothetical protein
MMRAATIRQWEIGYDESFRYAEDYELWTRLAALGRLANLGEILLHYRLHDSNVGQLHQSAQCASANLIRARQIVRLGMAPSSCELEIHEALSRWQAGPEISFLDKAQSWLEALIKANALAGWCDDEALRREAGARFFHACGLLSGAGLGAYRRFRNSRFAADARPSQFARWEFLGRCLLKLR